MRENSREYTVINVFRCLNDEEQKRKINAIVRALCILDIEKTEEKDYNIGVAFHDSVSDLHKGGAL